MTNDDLHPLFEHLSSLKSMTLRSSVDRRIRTRCHAALAARRSSPRTPRSLRVTEMLGAAAVALYLAAVITAAVGLIR